MELNKILNEIDSGPGYILGTLSQDDMECFNNIIRLNYDRVLLKEYPLREWEIKNLPLTRYHELKIDKHKELWPKEVRTFSENEVLIFRNSNLFRELEKCFGKIIISNEDNTRSEEIYWRLVRPDARDDIGPLHADSWFWDLQNGPIDASLRRLKIWISISNESGLNGFRFINGSQKKRYQFKGELRGGKMKPKSDPSLENESGLELANTSPGDYIIFHDDLIHGGFIGGSETRISFEMTLLVKK